MSSARLPFDESPDMIDDRIVARDRDARTRAVDPRYDVALEASAGTVKLNVRLSVSAEEGCSGWSSH